MIAACEFTSAEGGQMRIVLLAIGAFALVSMPAQAQRIPPWMELPKNEKEHTKADENPSMKADDKAYKSALDKVTPSKDFDPWGNVRKPPASRDSQK